MAKQTATPKEQPAQAQPAQVDPNLAHQVINPLKKPVYLRNPEATKVAIDPQKREHYVTPKGLEDMKNIHRKMNITGWVYGDAEDAEQLKAKILTPKDIKALQNENAILKAKLEAIESQKKQG